MKIKLAVCLAILSTTLFVGTFSFAGSNVYLGSGDGGTKSFDDVDHSIWNGLLQKYVDEDGMVDYRSLHQSRDDMRKLERYLATLSQANAATSSSADGKMAFWINAYNAVTIRGILREFPTSSIRNHTARFFGYNIWENLHLYVGGQAYSLDSMEHEILRKMGDPRIHFAVVCASIGCPRLLNEAYTRSELQNQLDLNSRDFFNRKQNFRYDASSNRIQLSSILKWYGSDFGSGQTQLLKRIATWLPASAKQAASEGRVSVQFLDYDWRLNSQ